MHKKRPPTTTTLPPTPTAGVMTWRRNRTVKKWSLIILLFFKILTEKVMRQHCFSDVGKMCSVHLKLYLPKYSLTKIWTMVDKIVLAQGPKKFFQTGKTFYFTHVSFYYIFLLNHIFTVQPEESLYWGH